MPLIKSLFFIVCFIATFNAELNAQSCTTPGQTPATAFPVCGTGKFVQESVPRCGGRRLPFKGCSADLIADVNPFYYKFTCYKTGTLGFEITPNNLSDDYDWELYDITGRDPNEIYSNGSLVVANNWSGEGGRTGTSGSASSLFVCGGYGKPVYSRMPQLYEGKNYLLLVSHFTETQSGYSLSFGGGTAVITDTRAPLLQSVEANCGGDELRVKINKAMRCNSLMSDGSDFYLTPGGISVVSAGGINCAGGFDSDSFLLKLSGSLPPGNYQLRMKKGGDNNTLLDICERSISETDALDLTILPKAPTPMDSLVTPGCAPTQLRLVFDRPMLCNSIAPNGSDFSISGSYPATVVSAKGECVNGKSKEIIITLSAPLQDAGSFFINLKKGDDGNTLFDECAEETPAGSALPFFIADTVNADFSHTISYGCETDTVHYFHDGGNDVNSWKWDLDDNQSGIEQSPVGYYTTFREKQVVLIVSNGVCKDTVVKKIMLENYRKADFFVYEDNCPSERIPFTNLSQGRDLNYEWTFGDGGTSTERDASHIYAVPHTTTPYNVRLTITDSFGCQSVAEKKLYIYSSCYLAVPNAFTPNNDGRNDVFGPLNAVKGMNLQFIVFNRWGQVMHRTSNWKQGWDGKLGGRLQPTGVYVWVLSYTDRDTNKKVQQKGTVTLIR